MRENNHEKYWLLSELDLYDADPDLKYYVGRPAGSSPKLRCLNSNLNEDVYKSLDRHVR